MTNTHNVLLHQNYIKITTTKYYNFIINIEKEWYVNHHSPVRLPGGHIVGASSVMNRSIVTTRWYFCKGSTLKYLSNGTCIYNAIKQCSELFRPVTVFTRCFVKKGTLFLSFIIHQMMINLDKIIPEVAEEILIFWQNMAVS